MIYHYQSYLLLISHSQNINVKELSTSNYLKRPWHGLFHQNMLATCRNIVGDTNEDSKKSPQSCTFDMYYVDSIFILQFFLESN